MRGAGEALTDDTTQITARCLPCLSAYRPSEDGWQPSVTQGRRSSPLSSEWGEAEKDCSASAADAARQVIRYTWYEHPDRKGRPTRPRQAELRDATPPGLNTTRTEPYRHSRRLTS